MTPTLTSFDHNSYVATISIDGAEHEIPCIRNPAEPDVGYSANYEPREIPTGCQAYATEIDELILAVAPEPTERYCYPGPYASEVL